MPGQEHPADVATSTVAFGLVATDLDGTLLRHDKTISERTRRALTRLETLGIPLALVSGRPPRTVRLVADMLGITGLAICCNGALTYDLARDEIVRHAPLAQDLARHLITLAREAVPGACFALEIGTRFACDRAFADLSPDRGEIERLWSIGEADALCGEPVTKLIVRHAELSCEALLERLSGIVGDAASVTYCGAPFIEIAAAGIHKAWALEALCVQLGLSAQQVIAFGDMPNDLAMLSWAGHSAAVANAHPEVRARAHEITLSNEEDGVAAVLERLFTYSDRPAPA